MIKVYCHLFSNNTGQINVIGYKQYFYPGRSNYCLNFYIIKESFNNINFTLPGQKNI